MIHKSSSPFRKKCTFFGSFFNINFILSDIITESCRPKFSFNRRMTGPSAESAAGPLCSNYLDPYRLPATWAHCTPFTWAPFTPSIWVPPSGSGSGSGTSWHLVLGPPLPPVLRPLAPCRQQLKSHIGEANDPLVHLDTSLGTWPPLPGLDHPAHHLIFCP